MFGRIASHHFILIFAVVFLRRFSYDSCLCLTQLLACVLPQYLPCRGRALMGPGVSRKPKGFIVLPM